jgi:hypothetical protein
LHSQRSTVEVEAATSASAARASRSSAGVASGFDATNRPSRALTSSVSFPFGPGVPTSGSSVPRSRLRCLTRRTAAGQ